MSDVVTAERVIPAPAERIFELLVDPSRHREIDGSGSLVGTKDGVARRLGLGDTFGMSMKMGVPYSMVSTIVELEDDRRIAWQTRGAGRIGQKAGGRIWRYELEPVEGGTLVRESWDISQESPLTKPLVKLSAGKTKKNMEATLARIEEVVTT